MYKEISNNPRQALKTEIKTCTDSDSGVVYYSILVETSSRMSPYNTIIKTFITQLQKTTRDCQIQIITFGHSVNTIFQFENNSIYLKNSLKEIKFSKDNKEANLGEALGKCYSNIYTCWTSDIVSKIIIFSSDNNTIFGLACGTNLQEVVKDLQLLLPDQKVIQLGKNPTQQIKSLFINKRGGNGGGSGGGIGINSANDILTTGCPINIEVYPHRNETRPIKDDLLLDVIIKLDDNTTLIPSNTKVKFRSNKYYSAYTIQLKEDLIFRKPYEETIKLDFKKGQSETKLFENFPSKIQFTIEIANEIRDDDDDDNNNNNNNNNNNIYQGHVYLNISYFLGELKSKYSFNIGVEGEIGNGKSTLLNGLVNLFNPKNELEEYFMIVNHSIDSHVTTSFNNTSLKEILASKQEIYPIQQSFQDIDIAWSDSWGFMDGDLPLKHKAKGRIHHGISRDQCTIQQPLEHYCIDCFIFVKIKEAIAIGITPLLAITFVDTLTKNQYQEIIKSKINDLSIQECNTFIICNYTEKETLKDITKDIQLLRLLTKAVQLSITKKEKDIINNNKNLLINNSQHILVKNQSSLSSSSSSSLFDESLSSTFSTLFRPSQSKISPMAGSLQSTRQTQQQQEEISFQQINVLIDVVSDAQGTILTSFEFETSLDEKIIELKNRLIHEIDPNLNANDWSIAKETGTILFESAKLSSIFKSEDVNSIKLVLKKKLRLLYKN
ncbi:hypothetical protein ACTA71_010946 [Dictyostelium dimigraforme]